MRLASASIAAVAPAREPEATRGRLFLNAVQRLAALANSFGVDVLRALVHVYADGLQGVGAGAITRQDVDVRVIRRSGETLPQYCQHRFHPVLCDRSNVLLTHIRLFGSSS